MSKKRTVCITGLGVVNPAGLNKDDFAQSMTEGQNHITPIEGEKFKTIPVDYAGQLKGFKPKKFIEKRTVVKTDTFTHYALAASVMALQDAGFNLEALSEDERYRMGVWLGNNAGGWDICERGLYEMYRDGPEFVNPWQATAWFLSAPQGYVTIVNDILGMSKSFVCDRASSASALYFAIDAIMEGRCEVILSGGAEAPITPFSLTCYHELGEMNTFAPKEDGYKPFDRYHSGLMLGEGATILVLEEKEHALKRGATIYAEFKANTTSTDRGSLHAKAYHRAVEQSLEMASVSPCEIDLLLPEGAAVPEYDQQEKIIFEHVFKAHKDLPVSVPKAGFGHMYGASTATDIAAGLLSAKLVKLPVTPNTADSILKRNVRLVTAPEEREVNQFMVTSRSRKGCNYSFVVSTN